MAVFNGTVEQIENTNNKVTSISTSSTDVQYPTAKAVYDFVSASAPEMEHGTWTPNFNSDFIASTEVCNCTYTILNEHEAYINMLIQGTTGGNPMGSAANTFTGFPLTISEDIGLAVLPVADVGQNTATDYPCPLFGIQSDGKAVLQVNLVANSDALLSVSGVITYA